MTAMFQAQNPSSRKPFWRSFLLPLFGWLALAHSCALVLIIGVLALVGLL